jgi:hypothetical protein
MVPLLPTNVRLGGTYLLERTSQKSFIELVPDDDDSIGSKNSIALVTIVLKISFLVIVTLEK